MGMFGLNANPGIAVLTGAVAGIIIGLITEHYTGGKPVRDIAKQGEILRQVAALVDSGKIKTTATHVVGKLNAENMRLAHQQLESGSTIGKWVLEGF